MADLESTTISVTFRYPDGSKEYAYVDALPIGGDNLSRHGTEYVVVAISSESGNAIITLKPEKPHDTDG
jgi:hypothetical protein